MEKKGRPVTRPPELKEGYYIEVKSRGASSGVKIRRDSKVEMEYAIRHYEKSKIITYVGQVVNGRWVDGKNKDKKTREK